MIYYTIIEDSITTGFFQNQKDRDLAFIEHIIKANRYGIKGTKEY